MAERRDSLRLVPGGNSEALGGVDSSGVVESGQSEHNLLLAGKISVDEYMDMTVDRALSHLKGQMSKERLAQMRSILRSELEHDPDLQALVRRVAVGD